MPTFFRAASASGFFQGNGRLPVIHESVLSEVEEGVVTSDHENRVISINCAAEAIGGVDARMSLDKCTEESYLPVGNGGKESSHTAVLNTGTAPNEHLNQCVVKPPYKITNVVERMYPVNIHGRITAVFSPIKNLPVIQKSMEQSLKLYDHFGENTPHNDIYYTSRSIVGSDIRSVEAVSDAKYVVRNQTTMLIYGETGTGKELSTQSIHSVNSYQNGSFISVNCAATPSTLLESMFFGTVKGSYTGAADTTGFFEQTRNGTLLLDEANSTDIFLQAKLLKITENKTARRIGGTKEREIRCRISCVLDEAPLACIENGEPHRDLYYRLSPYILYTPPLRERKNDIPLLCSFLLKRFNKEYGRHIHRIDSELMDRFLEYPWPSSAREPQHMVESTFSVSRKDMEILQFDHLSRYYRKFLIVCKPETVPDSQAAPGPASPRSLRSLKAYMDSCGKNFLAATLCYRSNNTTTTARSFQITRQALQHKIRKYGLQRITSWQ